MLAVCIKNDYKRDLKEKKGRFISTKKEENLHGWGLKSVEKCVEKYQGTIEYETKNGEFCVNLIMNYFVWWNWSCSGRWGWQAENTEAVPAPKKAKETINFAKEFVIICNIIRHSFL